MSERGSVAYLIGLLLMVGFILLISLVIGTVFIHG